MNHLNFSKIHRKIAPILLLPLLLTALTGLAFRIGRSWFGVSDKLGDTILKIHEGGFLGATLVPFYVLLMGLGLLGLLVTGLSIFNSRRNLPRPQTTPDWRRYHYTFALIGGLPLLLALLTGIAYRLGENWFGLSEEVGEILLDIHQGAYLGSALRPFYVLVLGGSLVILLVSGVQMMGFLRHLP